MTVTKHLIRRGIPLVVAALSLAVPATTFGATQRTAVTVQSCTTAKAPAARAVTFRATIGRRKGAFRMAIKVTLMRVPTPGLGTPVSKSPTKISIKSWAGWVRSRPGRSALIVTRRVDGLTGPASYYAQVDLRWYRKSGARIAALKLRSASCTQPGYGPDLSVGDLLPTVSSPGTSLPPPSSATANAVTVTVSNNGADPSRAATLVVSSSQGMLGQAVVPPIEAGTWSSVSVPLSSCPAGQPLTATVTADPADSESSYSNNSAVVGLCPG